MFKIRLLFVLIGLVSVYFEVANGAGGLKPKRPSSSSSFQHAKSAHGDGIQPKKSFFLQPSLPRLDSPRIDYQNVKYGGGMMLGAQSPYQPSAQPQYRYQPPVPSNNYPMQQQQQLAPTAPAAQMPQNSGTGWGTYTGNTYLGQASQNGMFVVDPLQQKPIYQPSVTQQAIPQQPPMYPPQQPPMYPPQQPPMYPPQQQAPVASYYPQSQPQIPLQQQQPMSLQPGASPQYSVPSQYTSQVSGQQPMLINNGMVNGQQEFTVNFPQQEVDTATAPELVAGVGGKRMAKCGENLFETTETDVLYVMCCGSRAFNGKSLICVNNKIKARPTPPPPPPPPLTKPPPPTTTTKKPTQKTTPRPTTITKVPPTTTTPEAKTDLPTVGIIKPLGSTSPPPAIGSSEVVDKIQPAAASPPPDSPTSQLHQVKTGRAFEIQPMPRVIVDNPDMPILPPGAASSPDIIKGADSGEDDDSRIANEITATANTKQQGIYYVRCGEQTWRTREAPAYLACCGSTLNDVHYLECDQQIEVPVLVRFVEEGSVPQIDAEPVTLNSDDEAVINNDEKLLSAPTNPTAPSIVPVTGMSIISRADLDSSDVLFEPLPSDDEVEQINKPAANLAISETAVQEKTSNTNSRAKSSFVNSRRFQQMPQTKRSKAVRRGGRRHSS